MYKLSSIPELDEWLKDIPEESSDEQMMGWQSAAKRIQDIADSTDDPEEAIDKIHTIIERTPTPKTDRDQGRLSAFQDAMEAIGGAVVGDNPVAVEDAPPASNNVDDVARTTPTEMPQDPSRSVTGAYEDALYDYLTRGVWFQDIDGEVGQIISFRGSRPEAYYPATEDEEAIETSLMGTEDIEGIYDNNGNFFTLNEVVSQSPSNFGDIPLTRPEEEVSEVGTEWYEGYEPRFVILPNGEYLTSGKDLHNELTKGLGVSTGIYMSPDDPPHVRGLIEDDVLTVMSFHSLTDKQVRSLQEIISEIPHINDVQLALDDEDEFMSMEQFKQFLQGNEVTGKVAATEDEMMQQWWQSQMDEAEKADKSELYQVIMDEGGISTRDDLREEYRLIPNTYKRKDGLRGDDMADVLSQVYPQFGIHSENDLIHVLHDMHRQSSLKEGREQPGEEQFRALQQREEPWENPDPNAPKEDLKEELKQFGVIDQPPAEAANVLVFRNNHFYWPTENQELFNEVTAQTELTHDEIMQRIMEYYPDASEQDFQVGYYLNGTHELYDTQGNFLGNKGGEENELSQEESIEDVDLSNEDPQTVLDYNKGQDLEGLPSKVKVRGMGEMEWHSHGGLQDLSKEYNDYAGIDKEHPADYVSVQPQISERIAQEFEQMQHDPHNPEVQEAYDALISETIDQYQGLVDNGYTFEFYPEEDPYPNSPREAVMDIHRNKHMYVYPTDEGFGSGDEEYPDHPLMQETGIEWNGKPVLANDLFRAVHDLYGHAKEGVGFRSDGEDNAFRQHSAMFSDTAQKALTSETRAQNSWVNYGPYASHNQTAGQADTVFAPQKAGIMPDWVNDPDIHKQGREAKRADFWDDSEDIDPYDMEGELDKEFSLDATDLENSDIKSDPVHAKVNKFLYANGQAYYWDAAEDIEHIDVIESMGWNISNPRGIYMGVYALEEDSLASMVQVPEINSYDQNIPEWVARELDRAFGSSTILLNGTHMNLYQNVMAEIKSYDTGVIADDTVQDYGVLKDHFTPGGYNKFIVADDQAYVWVTDPTTAKPFHMAMKKKIKGENPKATMQMTGLWSDQQDLYGIEGLRGNPLVKILPSIDEDKAVELLKKLFPDVPYAYHPGLGWINIAGGSVEEQDDTQISVSESPVSGANSLVGNASEIIFWADDGTMTHPEGMEMLYENVDQAAEDPSIIFGTYNNGHAELDGYDENIPWDTIEKLMSVADVQSMNYQGEPVGEQIGLLG